MRSGRLCRGALGTEISRGRRSRQKWSEGAGLSFLEVLVALALTLVALGAAAPALALSLRIASLHQFVLDRDTALERTWQSIAADPAVASQTQVRTVEVGDGRRVEILTQSAGRAGSLEKWTLSLTGSQYSQERWIAR